MPIDVSELMTDPDFQRSFTIKRPTVTLTPEGDAVTTYADIQAVGPVQPAKPSDAQYLPEGTRISDTIIAWSKASISAGDGAATVPDVIEWKGLRYRVIKLEHREDNGYTKAWAEGIVLP